MSLDVDLIRKYHVTYDNGKTLEPREESVYENNITHNLTGMADKAGLYRACWRPEELGITKANELIPILEKGLDELKANPKTFKQYNPSNGWGSYEGLVDFVVKYLEACREFPDAIIETCR